MQPATTVHVPIPPTQSWKLPPLILHPFSDAAGPTKLVESSRASMMLQGLLPNNEFTVDELDRKLIDGRYCEIRMLYYVGKDLVRWIEQCVDIVERDEMLKGAGLRWQSFAALLVDDPPEHVKVKLKKWGVADYKAIFARALGLNSVFADVPERTLLADDFIRNYYRFADHMFSCRQGMAVFAPIQSQNFHFDLFASGEYSRMLSREWEEHMDQ
jgi:hypothetical protein